MDKILLSQIKEVLEERGIEYYTGGEGTIEAEFREFGILYHVCEERMDFAVRINREVPQKRMGNMLFFLNWMNNVIIDGHLEMVEENVVYRMYTDRTIKKEIGKNRIQGVLERGNRAIELLLPAVEAICDGTHDGMEAMEEIVMPQIEEE